MRNPLRKRLLRDLKQDIGKYAVIFLFMVMLISLVSGFLVADNSIYTAYKEGFNKYNLEYGHMSFNKKPSSNLLETIEYKGDVKLYDLDYREISYKKSTIRIYQDRTKVNLECVMSGRMPNSDNEIALDRLYARNQKIAIGDSVKMGGKTLTVCGAVALPDYSCLFESNSDMMFDSVNFGVAIMTKAGYEGLTSGKLVYNYAWKYNKSPADDDAEKNMSDDFLENVSDVLSVYNQKLEKEQIDAIQKKAESLSSDMQGYLIDAVLGDSSATAKAEDVQDKLTAIQDTKLDDSNMISIDSYLPRYSNKAINYTGDDMSGDKIMFQMFGYIVTLVLAFIFAITISGTISNEAGTIGTLRASGYTRGELVRYYMTLPVLVTAVSAVVGNVVGYTIMKNIMADLYYNSYSLGIYRTLWNSEAFVMTTVVPIAIMFVVTLITLIRKMRLTPLQFLRHELTGHKSKLSMSLSYRIPFMHRFRIRIFFQNGAAYLVMFVGIILASFIAVFGNMFGPLLDDYSALVKDSEIAAYQYVMNDTESEDASQTKISSAEKYSVTTLETTNKNYMTDDVMIYGIQKNSKYVKADIPNGQVYINNGLMKKFGYKIGDTLRLKDPYSDDSYKFKIAGVYKYDAAISIFMNQDDYNEKFNEPDNYYSGYFSNVELTDLDEESVASVIDEADLTKIADQLRVSMGSFMDYMNYFAIAMFILMMYILTKHIIEKNAMSISMTKILGYTGGEIARLYLVMTSIVVIGSLLLAIPITSAFLRWVFTSVMYTQMTGYIPYIISNSCFIKMFVMGVASYVIVCAILMFKINRIPKSDALKNVE